MQISSNAVVSRYWTAERSLAGKAPDLKPDCLDSDDRVFKEKAYQLQHPGSAQELRVVEDLDCPLDNCQKNSWRTRRIGESGGERGRSRRK